MILENSIAVHRGGLEGSSFLSNGVNSKESPRRSRCLDGKGSRVRRTPLRVSH